MQILHSLYRMCQLSLNMWKTWVVCELPYSLVYKHGCLYVSPQEGNGCLYYIQEYIASAKAEECTSIISEISKLKYRNWSVHWRKRTVSGVNYVTSIQCTWFYLFLAQYVSKRTTHVHFYFVIPTPFTSAWLYTSFSALVLYSTPDIFKHWLYTRGAYNWVNSKIWCGLN